MSTTRKPHVVIAVPVYNGADFIGKAVASALDQDYEQLTVMVIDNASTDDTSAILRQFQSDRLLVKRFENFLPIAANWNRALEEATGDMVMLMSADNTMRAGAISALVDALSTEPQCGIAIGRTKYLIAPGHRRKVLDPFRTLNSGVIEDLEMHLLSYGYNFSINGVLFRRSLPNLYICPRAGYGCDLDLLLRLGQSGVSALAVDHTVIEWLDHPETLTFKQYDRVWEALIEVYIKKVATTSRRQAYRNRIGRMLTWECMLLLHSGDRALASLRLQEFGRHTSLAWRLMLRLMFTIPRAYLVPRLVRWVGSEDGPFGLNS